MDENIEMAKSIALHIKQRNANTIALIYGKPEGKPMICLMISDDLVETKKLDAAAYIKKISKEIQGGGGGQKHLATAGGKNNEGLETAIKLIVEELKVL